AFYAESGGQVGDTGVLVGEQGRFVVTDTQKQGGAFAHVGRVVEGSLGVEQTVETRIDAERRQAIRLNHSATHLLHAALRAVLGPHVQQKGSRVAPEELRFDFSHPEPISSEALARIESLVNQQIRYNAAVDTRVMPIEAAREAGAMALFGEKYGDEVRVVTMGDFSMELCGGTHARRVGDIGLFKITSEGGVAAGIRRIEAVTGAGALAWVHRADEQLGRIASLVKGGRAEAFDRVEQLLQRSRQLERELSELKARLASQAGGDLAAQAQELNGVRILAASIEGADQGALRETVDQLKNKLGTAAIVLAAVEEGKVRLVAGVTPDLTDRVKAGALVNVVAQQVGGKGGGRPDLAQAGGSDAAALPAALESARTWLREQLG
ncbi:MAG: DHHA1 domain-containing protein, partial [Halothiobacillaceae bacterium]